MDSKNFLYKLKTRVKQFDKDADIILYGSRARGDNNLNSDWDFLILLNFAVNESLKEQIRDELFEMELETDQVISTIIHSKNNWKDLSITPLYKNIKHDGVRL
jgi:predicted nucleotidyltransferase